jgi:hypothetical protein
MAIQTDMTTVRVVTVVVLIGCGISGQEADTLETVARGQPVITSTATADGFTQVRQNSVVSVVIKGKKLGRTTHVSVGPFLTTLDSVSAHELRVTALISVQPAGPLDVIVTSPDGIAIARDVLELTPFVVSPTAVGGNGTFQSPMNLCDPALERSGRGSAVLLLPGTHRCGRAIVIGAGSRVMGDPNAATIVTGTDDGGFGMIIRGDPSEFTLINDLTFEAPLAASSIELTGGSLDVSRVTDTGGITASGGGLMSISNYSYEGEGTGIDGIIVLVFDSTVRHCGDGIGIRVSASPLPSGNSALLLSNVLVEDCRLGVALVGPPGASNGLSADIRSSELIDNQSGIEMSGGRVFIQNTLIRDNESTTRPSLIGISQASGELSVLDIEITGQEHVGIATENSSNNFNATLIANGVVITGGRIGIEFAGINNVFFLHNSVVRDQTAASLLISSLDSFINVGELADPGNNALSVISGFAIDDVRNGTQSFSRYIQALGTTLNGVSFDGQTIEGPAELPPHYRISDDDSGIRFQ